MSIKVENLTHIYMPGTPFEMIALDDISLELEEGKFYAIIGHTGSGKSTFIQHLNGLLKPTSGKIFIGDVDITDKKTVMSEVRKRVGLVFQYPEYQLFEETIEKDVAFGPKNLGLPEAEIQSRVRKAMEIVGLDFEKFRNLSPFELSGGQKRRVAIAGVIAMEPQVLILDEPTAGLDPKGRDEILAQIIKLHEYYKSTVILVTHSMEDVAEIADEVIVMSDSKVIMKGLPSEVFTKAELLESVGLGAPQITYLMKALKDKGFDVSTDIFTVKDAKKELLRLLRKGGSLS
ncbi:energy-coupling factor transporter ATPase [Youngiibacter multivorans]|uniref:Energy-coupling factor transporter ATP-binding protein EcfA2 n=1 Tax=Youngiibacter multivorans TaxID=937251 RepID=A0ABS4G3G8_9CLOT|nr:energy-coupling factor transporter ATPase [Youngiibacter multivorans]MBP1919098.1 energy-coupling factor transport system ATP-binding protein [Youngiibacter multivorans]